MSTAFLAALLYLSATDDLPAELKKESARIEEQITQLEERAGRIDPTAADQSVKEIRQSMKEFAIDAEILDDDAKLEGWRKRLEATLKKAGEGQKKREAAMSAAAAARSKMLEERRDFSAEVRDLIKIPIDMNNISFKKDVAPIVQNACVRCHSTARASGSFDASTYAKIIEQIEPGKPEDSHMLKLVTGKAEPRMPRGNQTRFDQRWVEIWTAWIKQGAKFDGPSKTALISTYLVDLEVQRRAAIAALPESDLDKMHRSMADRQLVMTAASKPINRFETTNFLIMTTLPKPDAEYIGVLAEATLEEVYPKFGGKGVAKIWKGRLGVNAFADRIDYEAFAKLVDRYDPETHEFGHVRIAPEYQHVAYTSDHAGASLDGMTAQLITEAFIRQTGGGKAPAWVVHGYATTIAGAMAPKDPWVNNQLASSARLLAGGKNFGHLYGETVPWLELAPMSAGFFHFLASANQRKAADFVRSYGQTGDWQKSVGGALNSSPAELQRGWANWTISRGGKR